MWEAGGGLAGGAGVWVGKVGVVKTCWVGRWGGAWGVLVGGQGQQWRGGMKVARASGLGVGGWRWGAG